MLRRPHNIISYLKMNALPDESQKLLRDKVDQVRAESLASDIAEREVAGTLSLHWFVDGCKCSVEVAGTMEEVQLGVQRQIHLSC